jgi:hypothetical protein
MASDTALVSVWCDESHHHRPTCGSARKPLQVDFNEFALHAESALLSGEVDVPPSSTYRSADRQSKAPSVDGTRRLT